MDILDDMGVSKLLAIFLFKSELLFKKIKLHINILQYYKNIFL